MQANYPDRVLKAWQAIDTAAGTVNNSAGLIATKCRAMILGYDAKYGETEQIVPGEVEQMTTAELYNPATGRRSRTFGLAGVLDVFGTRRGRTIIVDHKTTSQDITDPAGPFWRQLVVEAQPSFYMLLKWLNSEKVDEAVWDAMRKPQIAPKKLSGAMMKAVASSGEYCGRRVTLADPSNWDGRETLEMYEARLADDCINVRPAYYFQRRSVPRLDHELIDYAAELWQLGQELLHERKQPRHVRNSRACMMYNSPCKFLGICSGFDTPESDRWTRKQQVHVELPNLDTDGRDVLTNSRLACYLTCRRKHYYAYELGIERVDEEEREALLFGTIWHQALAAWWSTFLPLDEESSNADSQSCPGNRLGNGGSNAVVERCPTR